MIPLVLVHGFMGGSDQWHLQGPLGDDRPLFALDLPGFGRNAHLPPLRRIADHAIWALGEIADRGCTCFDLLGHSMGGMVVQDMVRLAPERIENLILYGTGSEGVLPGRFETIETSKTRAKTEGVRATARRISATWFRDGTTAPEYEACAAIAESCGLEAVLAGLDAMQAWSGTDALSRIRARCLVLWGDRDRTYPWSQTERLWQTIPGCSLAVVPNCAHAVHLERHRIFNALVAQFLATGQTPS